MLENMQDYLQVIPVSPCIPQRIWPQMLMWLLRSLMMRKCNDLCTSVLWGGVLHSSGCFVSCGFFGMVVQDSSRLILLFQWFQKGLQLKHKTWCILPATPYPFPWQLSRCLGEFFPLPLKQTIEDDQLTPIKPRKGFASAGVPWFCPSLLLPVAFMHWALQLITNSHLLSASQSASCRLNLCCSLRPGSSATGEGWRCTPVLLDLWYMKKSSLASWYSENQPMVNIYLFFYETESCPTTPKGWESVKHFLCLLLLESDIYFDLYVSRKTLKCGGNTKGKVLQRSVTL